MTACNSHSLRCVEHIFYGKKYEVTVKIWIVNIYRDLEQDNEIYFYLLDTGWSL